MFLDVLLDVDSDTHATTTTRATLDVLLDVLLDVDSDTRATTTTRATLVVLLDVDSDDQSQISAQPYVAGKCAND